MAPGDIVVPFDLLFVTLELDDESCDNRDTYVQWNYNEIGIVLEVGLDDWEESGFIKVLTPKGVGWVIDDEVRILNER